MMLTGCDVIGKDSRFVMIECAGRGDPEGLIKAIPAFEFLMSRFQVEQQLGKNKFHNLYF